MGAGYSPALRCCACKLVDIIGSASCSAAPLTLNNLVPIFSRESVFFLRMRGFSQAHGISIDPRIEGYCGLAPHRTDDADTLWPADIHSAGGFSTRCEASSVPRSHSACRAATREEYGPMDKAIEQIVNARVRLQTGKLLRTDLKGRSASAMT